MQIECGQVDDPVGLVVTGPTVVVHIGFDPKYKAGGGNIPNLPERHFAALVDTGATLSCIDSAVARMLELPEVDQTRVGSALGSGTVNVHLAQIYIPKLQWVITGRFSGVHLHEGGQAHSVLLGRRFLANMHMVYDGKSGSVVISRKK